MKHPTEIVAVYCVAVANRLGYDEDRLKRIAKNPGAEPDIENMVLIFLGAGGATDYEAALDSITTRDTEMLGALRDVAPLIQPV